MVNHTEWTHRPIKFISMADRSDLSRHLGEGMESAHHISPFCYLVSVQMFETGSFFNAKYWFIGGRGVGGI